MRNDGDEVFFGHPEVQIAGFVKESTMKLTRSSIGVAVGLAFAGIAGGANAASVGSATVITNTATTFEAQWIVSGTGSFATALQSFGNWDILGLSGYMKDTVSLGTGLSVNLNEFDVAVQHAVAPHVGENLVGPIYDTSVQGQTIVQLWNSGNTSFVSAMAAHDSGVPATWVTPADWTSAHWDQYKFTATSNTNGTATLTLQAIHPVPEPDSYSMMLAGIGLVGFIVSRRRKAN